MSEGVTVVTGAVEGFDYGTLDSETRIVVQQRTGEIRSLVLFVDDGELSKLAKASYSGDTLTGYGKPPYLRGMFEYDGRRWVAVVGNGTSVRVHELDEELSTGVKNT